jgi:hypothetical protein
VSTTSRRRNGVITAAALGMAGGLLGSFAMNQFARVVSAGGTRREGEGAAPGGDRVGRGVQPPQAEGRAEEDATAQTGAAAYRAITGIEPDRDTRRRLGSAAHYAFGGAVGMAYGLLSTRVPSVRAGFGTFYGALVWAIADEGVMPALGLSRGPRQLTPGVLAYGLLGHFVFGAALESTLRLGGATHEPGTFLPAA